MAVNYGFLAQGLSKAVDAYERLGLPALPALIEQMAKMEKDGPAAAEMKSLAARMACIVDDIQFVRRYVKPDGVLRQRFERLKNKPLTPIAFIGAPIATAERLPKGAAGVKLTARQPGDNTGITIIVTLPQERVFQGALNKGWSTSTYVSVGKETLASPYAPTSSSDGDTFEPNQELIEALKQALAAAPEKPLVARASLVRER